MQIYVVQHMYLLVGTCRQASELRWLRAPAFCHSAMHRVCVTCTIPTVIPPCAGVELYRLSLTLSHIGVHNSTKV